MKRKEFICIIAIVCAAVVLFFPVSKTRSFSGNGSVLNSEREKIGDCTISIEVKELKSLVLRYRMNFSFTMNDEPCYASEEIRFPVAVSVTEYGDCLLSQFYYDSETNRMQPCSLFYRGDLSYAEIFWKNSYYSIEME